MTYMLAQRYDMGTVPNEILGSNPSKIWTFQFDSSSVYLLFKMCEILILYDFMWPTPCNPPNS